MLPKIVGAVMGTGVLAMGVWAVYSVRKTIVEQRPSTWLEVFDFFKEKATGTARFHAGELSPDKWGEIIQFSKLSKKLKCIEVIAGPWLLIKDSGEHNQFHVEGRFETLPINDGMHYQLKNKDDIWNIHPVMQYLHEDLLIAKQHGKVYNRKIRVYLKHTALNPERHFCHLENNNTYIELHHDRGPFQGAKIYPGDSEVNKIKYEDWNNIIKSNLCEELTLDTNLEEMLEYLQFCPASKRPKEYAKIPA